MHKKPTPAKTRFQPILVAKIAKDLKRGRQRRDIIRELSQKFTIPLETVKAESYRIFPVKELKELTEQKGLKKALEELLWRYRYSVKSRDAIREKHRNMWLRLSPEEKELKRQQLVTGTLNRDPKERSRISIEMWKKLSIPERQKRLKEAAERRKLKKLPETERLLLELEELDRTWPLRKHFVDYVDSLPILNRISKEELRILFLEHLERLKKTGAQNENAKAELFPFEQYFPRWFYWSNAEFSEFSKVFESAIIEAIRKWDKKRDLKQLVDDCVILRVFELFDLFKKRV